MKMDTCAESPRTLENRIEQMVRSHTGGTIRDLRVMIADEAIVITGRTANYYQKQLATAAVRRIHETASLSNDIEVG